MINSDKTTFHFGRQHHRLSHGGAAKDLMLQSIEHKTFPDGKLGKKIHSFSDWTFYRELQEQPGCTGVELSQIHIDHNSWFLTGIQATYKSTFANGSPAIETIAPLHEFQRFRYRQYGQSTRSTLVLKDREYITNLSLRTVDHIVDRITIATNQRQVSFGSRGFSAYSQQSLLPILDGEEESPFPYRRVVALAGLTSVMAEVIGCFSESMHWMRLKDLILTRKLVEENRAEHVSQHQKMEGRVLENLVVNTNDDVFREILSFLVPNTVK